LRLAVYCDYRFWRAEGRFWTERAFIVFLGGLAEQVDRLVMPGRTHPDEGRAELSHYPLPDGIEFVPLPWYETLAKPFDVIGALLGSMRRFWRVLDDVDAVWLLGPHPTCLAFAALAALRRKKVILGVRQDLPTYARTKHPGRRGIQLAADALEGSYRLLSRRCPTVVVGPDLARKYHRAPKLLPISVSLIRAAELPETLPSQDWDGDELRALSVGRLEAEKNPLLLADVIAELRRRDPRWRLDVCGEGPLDGALRERLVELGVDEDGARMLGYVPVSDGLPRLYRSSQAMLHVSFTEGVPQIMFEAFAAGLPIVATAVGGVPEAVGDDALLIPPSDANAAADALERLAADPELRERLRTGGLARVRDHTLEAECARLAAFLRDP
jgi:glycosyltransferase involved in cell wall biosynthesis